jgi:hypothetical protein
MTITSGVGSIVKVVVLLRKLKVTSNSSFNFLHFCFFSKILVSFVVGVDEASGST